MADKIITPLSAYKDYYKTNETALLNEFFSFLKIPSVSSEPQYGGDIKRCARWVETRLRQIGFEVEVWETSGHPAIFGSCMEAGPDKPTLLIYNHYDVQPVDPLSLWTSSPFEPTVKQGVVYARGAQDNKGQCFYTLLGLKALREIRKKFPINIKIIVEGEEECGSKGLHGVVGKHQDQLAADYLAIVDGGLPAENIPAVSLGVRGIVTMHVKLTGSSTDLHSGSHGGIVYNPNHAIVELLAKLRNSDGSIAVPGFYDEVQPVPDDVLNSLYMDFDEEHYLKNFGASPTGGEKAYPPLQRACLRPTIEINGIWGGYIGDGFKTVIPKEAHAKISCRLVSKMNPAKTAERVADFLKKHAPPGITVEVEVYSGGGEAVRADANSAVVAAFRDALTEIFGAPCKYTFEGGSIPIITALANASNSSVVIVGMGLAEDNIHAPNEHFSLDRLEKGYLMIARAIELLA